MAVLRELCCGRLQELRAADSVDPRLFGIADIMTDIWKSYVTGTGSCLELIAHDHVLRRYLAWCCASVQLINKCRWRTGALCS